jgi:LPS export ABC transporter protein LptC
VKGWAWAAALTLAACRPASRGGGTESQPEQILRRFTLDNYVEGGRTWSLTAPRATFMEMDNRLDVEGPFLRFYDRGRAGSTVNASRGSVDTRSGDLRAWDGVIMTSTEGARLTSEWVNYGAKDHLLVSTAPVTITRGRSVVRGVGWEASVTLGDVRIHNQRMEISPEDQRRWPE